MATAPSTPRQHESGEDDFEKLDTRVTDVTGFNREEVGRDRNSLALPAKDVSCIPSLMMPFEEFRAMSQDERQSLILAQHTLLMRRKRLAP